MLGVVTPSEKHIWQSGENWLTGRATFHFLTIPLIMCLQNNNAAATYILRYYEQTTMIFFKWRPHMLSQTWAIQHSFALTVENYAMQ